MKTCQLPSYIATVPSFTTLGVTYEVHRVGVPVAEGGNGVAWICSCPSNTFRPETPCKHLRALWSGPIIGMRLSRRNAYILSWFGNPLPGVVRATGGRRVKAA